MMPERKNSVDAVRIGVDTGERDNNLVMASQETSETENPSCSASSPDVTKVDAQPQVHSALKCGTYVNPTCANFSQHQGFQQGSEQKLGPQETGQLPICSELLSIQPSGAHKLMGQRGWGWTEK